MRELDLHRRVKLGFAAHANKQEDVYAFAHSGNSSNTHGRVLSTLDLWIECQRSLRQQQALPSIRSSQQRAQQGSKVAALSGMSRLASTAQHLPRCLPLQELAADCNLRVRESARGVDRAQHCLDQMVYSQQLRGRDAVQLRHLGLYSLGLQHRVSGSAERAAEGCRTLASVDWRQSALICRLAVVRSLLVALADIKLQLNGRRFGVALGVPA